MPTEDDVDSKKRNRACHGSRRGLGRNIGILHLLAHRRDPCSAAPLPKGER
jgi:hypothetical protein